MADSDEAVLIEVVSVEDLSRRGRGLKCGVARLDSSLVDPQHGGGVGNSHRNDPGCTLTGPKCFKHTKMGGRVQSADVALGLVVSTHHVHAVDEDGRRGVCADEFDYRFVDARFGQAGSEQFSVGSALGQPGLVRSSMRIRSRILRLGVKC
jgi:hypothetical protein